MQKEKLGILVPYRDREENLSVFVPYMNDYMKTNFPEINYRIFVFEQGNNDKFNKGKLFNCGFLETYDRYDYVALHDVDMIPISANYTYNPKPLHLAENVYIQDTTGALKLFYTNTDLDNYYGGVTMLDKRIYEEANGHSNEYIGWGSEDDDFNARLVYSKNPMVKHFYKENDKDVFLGNYITLNHKNERFQDNNKFNDNANRFWAMKDKKIDWESDGLNNIQYKLIEKKSKKGYTKLVFDF